MDLAAISQADFDVKEWTESVFKERREGESVESFVSNVSIRLQLLSQDLNSELEKGLMGIITTFPRAMSQVSRLENSYKDLKGELGNVLSQAQKARGEKTSTPDDPVEVLAQLHQLRSHMETCRDTLTEAANWNKLVRDVNIKFASGELTQLAEQLQSLKHSQQILENMPGAAERIQTVKHLEDQLGVVLKPRVQHAIQNETISALQEFADLFRKLGRLDSLVSEYAKSRPAQIHRYWFAYPASDKFKDWLPGYYKQVSMLMAEEKRRCHDVFGPTLAPSVLSSLVVETFDPLTNSYQNRLSHQLTFPEVVNLCGDTTQFLAEICGFVGVHVAKEAAPIVTTVFQPYADFVRRYEELEHAGTDAWLSSSIGATQEVLSAEGDLDSPLPVQMEEILDLVTGAFPVVEHLIERSIRFSSGFHARELLKVVNRFLAADVARFTDIFAATRQRCGLTRAKTPIPPATTDQGPLPPPPPRPSATVAFEFDHLQGALRLLQAFGRHFGQLSQCEKGIVRSLAQMFTWIFGMTEEDGGRMPSSAQGISLIWVDSLLQRNEKDRADLRGFLRTFTEPVLPGEVLKTAFRSANNYSAEARRLVFDVCIRLVKDRMSEVPTLKVWAADETGDWDSGYYSNVPQPYITQVGDYILSLIQHLEDFAASDALQEVSTVMTGLDRLTEPDWRDAGAALGLNELEVSILIKPPQSDAEDDYSHAGGDEALHFCNCWLGVIANSTVAVLLNRICAIEKLSAKGIRQLETDSRYLLTVFQNLEVRPHPMLPALYELAGLEIQQLEERLQDPDRGADRAGLATVISKLETKLARIRGIVA